MKDEYIEIRINFNDDNYERLYTFLYLHQIESILEESSQLIFYIQDKSKIELLKKDFLDSKLIPETDFLMKTFDDKDWNLEWERSIEPIYIKDRIIIYPSWKREELKDIEGKVLIEIDPKMSFGTGHNETTQLVLELMSDHISGNEGSMLDFGCGTAILAIAAVKLGVGKAVAIDTDDDSIVNAKEYIAVNNVEDKIEIIKADIKELEKKDFDVVCANIIRTVIVESFSEINNKLKSGGKLFLSGILCSEDMHIAIELKRYGFELMDKKYSSEWTGYFAVKN
jgi:ribosomal protein L11 methyltransferase